MFSGQLRDTINRVFGNGVMQWQRVIDAFRLKYPGVRVSVRCLMNDRDVVVYTPGAFLVWKIGTDYSKYSEYFEYSEIPAGAYVVQLFRSQVGAGYLVERMFPIGSRGRFARSTAEAGKDTVITDIARFHYEALVGELALMKDFYQSVLKEDAQQYLALANRSLNP